MNAGLELIPLRRGLLISASVEILTHVGGLAVTVPFYHRRSVTLVLGLGVGLAAATGLLSWLAWRTGLRRVVAPPPQEARIVSDAFPLRDVLWTLGWTSLLIVASLAHVLSPAFFGVGTGAGLAKLWSVRKIGEFERADGRRVLRRQRRSPWDRTQASTPARSDSFTSGTCGRRGRL
ncbi:MAG: hypothetical protein M3256_10670 [Actinomycetota bacterium]|nr:hypothetical protein [Actinomycetota bacterium]